jgi:hypothetical protein
LGAQGIVCFNAHSITQQEKAFGIWFSVDHKGMLSSLEPMLVLDLNQSLVCTLIDIVRLRFNIIRSKRILQRSWIKEEKHMVENPKSLQ